MMADTTRPAAEIAVLMAAYNAEKTLRRAVDSVLASPVPVDLYIVDDGSAVPVRDVLAPVPEHVVIHRLPKNSGLAEALNAGLDLILKQSYTYVARFDADDFCYPERFAAQLAYMEAHPEVQMVGCWARAIDERTGETLFEIKHPEKHEDIKIAMNYNSVFVHPGVMFRAEMLRGMESYYTSRYHNVEDYAFFLRIVERFKTANVPLVLLDYTYLAQGALTRKRYLHLWNRMKVQAKHLRFANPHSWLGLAKTFLLFCLPLSFLTALKKKRVQ